MHRTTVAVPYRASVVPKGARNARIQAFRLDVPVEIELLDEAPPVAVSCRPSFGPSVDYGGHAGALWLPIASGVHRSAPALPAETVLRHFERGHDFIAQTSRANPFNTIGQHRRAGLQHSVFSGRIEDEMLRSVQWEESGYAAAAAQRVARDLLLTADGQILRRSQGPVWTNFSTHGLDLILRDYEIEATARHSFCCTRIEEAADWFRRLHGFQPAIRSGQIDVIMPEHVEDRDAEEAARGVLARNFEGWLRLVEPLASPSVAALAREARTGIERLHGIDFDLLNEKRNRDLYRPVEAERPGPGEILAAVEAFRLFVAEMPGDIGDDEALGVCSNWRRVFEDLSGLFLRRFDEFEAPRIEARMGADLPDLGTLPALSNAP